jgi:hypothetical protein
MKLKIPQASVQLAHELGGYIRRMRSCATTGTIKNKNQRQVFSTEPVRESLTPSRARGLLTRAQIRAPFDGEIISPEVKSSDTIDNVKAKIDNMKAKIQDQED